MYKILIKKSAVKFLQNLADKDLHTIHAQIQILKENPKPNNSIKIKGTDTDLYRLKKGNFRILYHIYNDILVIEIIKISYRKDAYKNL